ncbi:hypothetical protein J2T57_001398 [Natronocella acetinitrilica]|uniref:Serine hydrolase n=1 Tax=Natronocella acetinitrilica TaxID=414046 RepID=A0AAE3G213_9GAMM|nr:hypothetical protein [Natronocella acetinitrilica]MCP1674296.1 hypothetical protein [Natronocella acetinitrilica]
MMGQRIRLLALTLAAASVLLVATLTASADERAEREALETLLWVASVDGGLDQEIHAYFWSQLRKVVGGDPDSLDALARYLGEGQEANVAFQRAVWESVQRSNEAGAVVRTPGLERATEALIAQFGEAVVGDALASTESLLRGAAFGEVVRGGSGSVGYIDTDSIARVVSGLDATGDRLAKLLDRDWDGALSEQIILPGLVRVLTPTRFVVERMEDTPGHERTEGFTADRRGWGVEEGFSIIRYEAGVAFDGRAGMREGCRGMFSMVGAGCETIPMPMRGHEGVRASTSFSEAGQSFGIAFQAIWLVESRAVVMAFVIDEGGVADAQAKLTALLTRTRFD